MTFVFASYLSFLSITFPSFLSLGPLYFYLLLLLLPMSPPHPCPYYFFLLISSPIYPYSLFLPPFLCCVNLPLFPILPSFPPAGHPIFSLLPLSPSPFPTLLLSSYMVPLSFSNSPLPPTLCVSLFSSLTCLAGI